MEKISFSAPTSYLLAINDLCASFNISRGELVKGALYEFFVRYRTKLSLTTLKKLFPVSCTDFTDDES